MAQETFTHRVNGAQYTHRADGTYWYKGLQISRREYDRAKAQNERMEQAVNTKGNYDLVCDDFEQGMQGVRLETAYALAKKIAASRGQTVNVWREYPEHWAMLGSVYPDGRVVGISSDDTWELAAAAMGEK